MARKQLPRTNWEVTITRPDGTTEIIKRRLTTMSLANWVDQIIRGLGYGIEAHRTRIEVVGITETGERRHIARY